ncbi:MAG: hypothetical protein DRI65_09625 [Chloroflexota bacterium]|nr:MAG: hypothetical protein DRI65_09625 [Chloroflexota bacterium]
MADAVEIIDTSHDGCVLISRYAMITGLDEDEAASLLLAMLALAQASTGKVELPLTLNKA